MIKIHPSSLSDIMTMAKGKGPEVLSVGAGFLSLVSDTD